MTDTRAVHPDTRSVRTRRPAAAVITEPADAGAEPLCELDHASRLLGGASDVVLLAHVNPDADALGSALALGLGLERRGTPVVVSFAEPDQVRESLRNCRRGRTCWSASTSGRPSGWDRWPACSGPHGRAWSSTITRRTPVSVIII